MSDFREIRENRNCLPLSEGLFWLGRRDGQDFFQNNSYLLIDGSVSVLINPGSHADFTLLHQALTSQIPLADLTYIILQNQNPDSCSSLPDWEASGFEGRYVSFWKTALSLSCFSLSNNFIPLNIQKRELSLETRVLKFPFISSSHSSAAGIIWEKNSGILFSGYFFSSLGYEADRLWYHPEDLSRQILFFRHYFFEWNSLLDVIDILKDYPVERIFPQHGYLVGGNIKGFLYNTASMIKSAGRPEDTQNHDSFTIENTDILLTKLNKVVQSIFAEDDKHIITSKFPQFFAQPREAISNLDDFLNQWELFFLFLGYSFEESYLLLLYPFVLEWMSSDKIPMPSVYHEENDTSRKIASLISKSRSLDDENFRLYETIIQEKDSLIKDPLTKLYNENFFQRYLATFCLDALTGTIIFIRLDQIGELNKYLGSQLADNAIKVVLSELMNHSPEDSVFFRLSGPRLVCLLSKTSLEQGIRRAEQFRALVESSNMYVTLLSISQAIVGVEEFLPWNGPRDSLGDEIIRTGKKRLESLDSRGVSSIYKPSEKVQVQRKKVKILILCEDVFQAGLLAQRLEKNAYDIILCHNGLEAFPVIESQLPDVVIADYYLPQMDALRIRQKMLFRADLDRIPMVLISHQKSEKNIAEAHRMGIFFYLKRPLNRGELEGIIQYLIEKKE